MYFLFRWDISTQLQLDSHLKLTSGYGTIGVVGTGSQLSFSLKESNNRENLNSSSTSSLIHDVFYDLTSFQFSSKPILPPFTLSSSSLTSSSLTSTSTPSLLIRSPHLYNYLEETVSHYQQWFHLTLTTKIPSELYVMFFDEDTMKVYNGLFTLLLKVYIFFENK